MSEKIAFQSRAQRRRSSGKIRVIITDPGGKQSRPASLSRPSSTPTGGRSSPRNSVRRPPPREGASATPNGGLDNGGFSGDAETTPVRDLVSPTAGASLLGKRGSVDGAAAAGSAFSPMPRAMRRSPSSSIESIPMPGAPNDLDDYDDVDGNSNPPEIDDRFCVQVVAEKR